MEITKYEGFVWLGQARPRLIEAIEKGDISEVVDPRLEKHYIEEEVYRMIETAASCVRHSALKRPRMVQVRTDYHVVLINILY